MKTDPVWLFDLDNTLHDASPHIFPHINRSMGEYIERHLGLDQAEAHRQGGWRLQRHHQSRSSAASSAASCPYRAARRQRPDDVRPAPGLLPSVVRQGGNTLLGEQRGLSCHAQSAGPLILVLQFVGFLGASAIRACCRR